MGADEQGADRSIGRWMTIPRTLSFIRNDHDVLLMKRSETARVFPGRYNGLGGHIERDEDPYASALREIREETGLVLTQVTLRGISHIDAGSDVGIMLFVFTGEAPSREVVPCSEGSLHWVPLGAISDLPVVEDLPIFLPRLYGPAAPDSLFFAHVSYDQSGRMIVKFTDNPV